MSLSVGQGCILCGREPAKDSKVLYITKGYISSKFTTWTKEKVAVIARYGGKVKPRGLICAECAQQYLPEQLRFEP
jgi:hypothetical protein